MGKNYFDPEAWNFKTFNLFKFFRLEKISLINLSCNDVLKYNKIFLFKFFLFLLIHFFKSRVKFLRDGKLLSPRHFIIVVNPSISMLEL